MDKSKKKLPNKVQKNISLTASRILSDFEVNFNKFKETNNNNSNDKNNMNIEFVNIKIKLKKIIKKIFNIAFFIIENGLFNIKIKKKKYRYK